MKIKDAIENEKKKGKFAQTGSVSMTEQEILALVQARAEEVEDEVAEGLAQVNVSEYTSEDELAELDADSELDAEDMAEVEADSEVDSEDMGLAEDDILAQVHTEDG